MRSRDRLCVVIGAGALVASTLVLGGVFRWVQAIVAGIVAAALITQVPSRRKLDQLSPIVVLLGAAIVLTALQLVPLPESVVSALNPSHSQLRTDGAALSNTSPWSCLSMDPPSTLRALTFLITLLGIALLALRLSASDRGRFMLIGGVAITCGIVAIVTALHAIVNTHSIYGYFDVSPNLPIVGPLVNPNHLGCLMAFGASLAAGLAFYEKQTPTWRALWVVIAVGCASITLLSESRGAAIGLALGIATTGTILIGQRLGDVRGSDRRTSISAGRLPIVIVLAIGFSLAVYASAGGVAEQLGRTSLLEVDHTTSKFSAWRAGFDVIRAAPLLGIGRGALEPVFTSEFPGSAYVTFSHLENEYLQAIVDWGLIGAIVLGIAFGWCLLTALRKWRGGPLSAAALGGLAGIAFQSSVDFGVELLGIAVPAVIVAATLQTVPLRETSKTLWLRGSRIALIGALLASTLVLCTNATRTLSEDHGDLRDSSTLATITDVIERHPLDYYAYGVASQALLRAKDARTIDFLNHALRLHPYQPGLHRFAARQLIGSGHRTQAAIEYSLAMRGAPTHSLLAEIVQILPNAREAATAIPLDHPNPTAISKSLGELKRSDVAVEWLRRKALDPTMHDLQLVDQLYDLAVSRNDLIIAMEAATRRLALVNTASSRLMIARIAFRQADYPRVYELLADIEKWTGRIDERAEGWLMLCDAYRVEQRWNEASKCLHMLDASGSLAARRFEIVKRENEIADRRATEIRTKHIQDLERSMGLPVDTELPVLKGVGSAVAPGPQGPRIKNPIRNPLNQQGSPRH